MAKLTALRVQRCENIPRPLVTGVLYISDKFHLAIHLCPCGCGSEAVTPIKHADGDGWEISSAVSGNETTVTLAPSILLRSECRSHYFIRDNTIVWC